MCINRNRHMNNAIEIEGHKATVSFNRETGLFRGEFTGLNSSADFYASSVNELIIEGRTSLKVFFEFFAEKGIEPLKSNGLKLETLRREITEGLASGESKPLHMTAIKREARKAANL
jgi:predicted HicB family RNase H-like nuclease